MQYLIVFDMHRAIGVEITDNLPSGALLQPAHPACGSIVVDIDPHSVDEAKDRMKEMGLSNIRVYPAPVTVVAHDLRDFLQGVVERKRDELSQLAA